MFFLMPLVPILGVYILAAVLPAIVLLRYIYRYDTVEKEPADLLIKLLLAGVLSALCAGILESIAHPVLSLLVGEDSPLYTVLFAFLVVAVVEEGTKLFFLKRNTWRHPDFNYRFDGVVYAVFVSLGFAAYENIRYVFAYGLSVALPRALLAIPGHAAFAVYMGVFYGRAKVCRANGDGVGVSYNLWVGYLIAVFLHGFYDACAMTGTTGAMLLFVVFVVLMDWRVIRRIKRESALDRPISDIY